ncbi:MULTISPECIES: glycoside hydrolase family 43 protein [Paraliobacillus]|uniref:glycoside hydrolase family 43 protein n=1 Tax=Paraliobacillus TaxID=200903 RepID=UPI000DD4D9C6|nr:MULTISPECIES: glycoside hydrolase family 43 protein [Paraliobacillus]
MKTFKNPIIAGFYPDPSICLVNDDYYLVTSTFEYFPGVPIFHSKDLVHWKQIGHVLDRPSQLNLDETPYSKGIYAPTIRYDDGIFYMITTFVVSQTGARKNFYVTATDPAGPWSDPNWLVDAPGIDPSLLFDDDGKVYYTGNRRPPNGSEYPKHNQIWLQELDLEQRKLVGPTFALWEGALKYAHAQEAPHLYKIDNYYYLLIAEGGTGFTHAVTIARSENITGPYESTETNPILTHRHLGRDHEIANVGHADIVQTQTGDWWMVCLASRPYGGYRNLGRETFLVPFKWENGWPVVNPGKGMIESEMAFPNLSEHKWPSLPACDPFEKEVLDLRWNFLRTPRGDFWSLTERPGFLRLKPKKETIMEASNPAFVGRRQQDISFYASTVMEFKPEDPSESAGLVLLQNEGFQFRMERILKDNKQYIQLVRREAGKDELIACQELDDLKKLYLKVEAYGQAYSFYYGTIVDEWRALATDLDGTILSTDKAGGFVGAYIGLYASSNGNTSSNYADFDWFEYKGTE